MANLRLHQLNDVKLVGRLTRDPDLRFTPKGQAVCHFRLAVGRRFKDKATNEWREEAAFVPIVAWREMAERCGERLKKGSPIYVEGRLRSREWETKEGTKRFDLEVEAWRIQFLAMTPDGEPGGDAAAGSPDSSDAVPADPVMQEAARPARASVPEPRQEAADIEDEEVPF